MKALRITPLDVVSVRDGRSFDAGGASLARALWPPTPWTVLGAVRAQLVRAMGCDPAEYGGRGWHEASEAPDSVRSCVERLGPPEHPPNFALGPVLIARNAKDLLFPLPLDLVQVKVAGVEQALRLEPKEAGPLREAGARWSNDRREWVLFPPREGHPEKKPPYRYLTAQGAREWLSGGTPTKAHACNEDPFVAESRIGIAMDPDRGRVMEGMFYQRRAYAPKGEACLRVPLLDLAQDLEAVLARTSGLGELGGDRHLVRFAWDDFEWPSATGGDDGRSVLWFLSPVRPDDVEDAHLSEVAGASVRVLAVASGKAMAIGGWRMWRGANRPRPMRRYYPAGTCVFVQGNAGPLHGRSIASDPFERAAGFGVCLVGAWPRSQGN